MTPCQKCGRDSGHFPACPEATNGVPAYYITGKTGNRTKIISYTNYPAADTLEENSVTLTCDGQCDGVPLKDCPLKCPRLRADVAKENATLRAALVDIKGIAETTTLSSDEDECLLDKIAFKAKEVLG